MKSVLALALLLFAGPAFAVLPSEKLADPALEARARALGQELRCLVCQIRTRRSPPICAGWCASA